MNRTNDRQTGRSLRTPATALLALATLAALALPASARVKLVTLPDRDTVSLNLDHPHRNLLTEERVIALDQGTNRIDFSWQGVSIDPASIQLQALDHPAAVRIINVSYPPNENALVWEVYSDAPREERFRIYYLIGGFDRQYSYRFTTDADEANARVEVNFKIANSSGESLEDARIDAVTGAGWTRSIQAGSTRELTAHTYDALPVTKRYIYRPGPRVRGEDYENVPLYYEIKNGEGAGLGDFKLPRGKVRIFLRDEKGSTVFLGEDWLPDLPVQEKHELALGTARDVVIRRNILRDERENIRRNAKRKIVLSDRVVTVRYEIENFKDTPVDLKIVETIDDYWRVEKIEPSAMKRERKDATTLEMTTTLPPKGEKQEFVLVYRMKNQTR